MEDILLDKPWKKKVYNLGGIPFFLGGFLLFFLKARDLAEENTPEDVLRYDSQKFQYYRGLFITFLPFALFVFLIYLLIFS